jgi:hypothetical protein
VLLFQEPWNIALSSQQGCVEESSRISYAINVSFRENIYRLLECVAHSGLYRQGCDVSISEGSHAKILAPDLILFYSAAALCW